MRTYYVYIMASRAGVLYVGVTRRLDARVRQHRSATPGTFVGRYRVHRLVYYEATENPYAAISREKEIKRWRRAKKIALIATMNPEWRDLAPDVGID